MEKQDANRQRGDLGEALKVAAGLTVAGLGFLGARHVNSKKNRLKSAETAAARRQARSSEWQVKLHQNAGNTRREELRESHTEKNQLVKDLDETHQCIDELLKQKKQAAQLLDEARAFDLGTIEDLKTDITTVTAESVRLTQLAQQEGAAKAAAVNVASKLRAQVDDLQKRLESSLASEDATTHQLSVYKQQRDAQAEVLSKEQAVLQIQVMRLQAGAAAESRRRCVPDRLAAEVNAEKAARAHVEQACAQLGMQLLDLQRRLRASQTHEAAATSALNESMEQREAEREVLIQETTVLHHKMASLEKLRAGDAAESRRLAAEVIAEKAARQQVEQACTQLGMQLLDLQPQLRASQTREAVATSDLNDATQEEDLAVEKAAHKVTAGKRQREVEAFSIALRQAEAELDRQRPEAVQQLAGKQAVLHHGAVHPAHPASTSLGPHQLIPSFQPSQEATWRVTQLASTAFEARVRATHGHQGPFDLIRACFCSSNSACKGVYRTFRDVATGLVGKGGLSSVYYLERQTPAGWQPVTVKQFTPDKVEDGKQEQQGLLAARGVPHVAQLVEAFTFQESAAHGNSLFIITEYAEGQSLCTVAKQLSQEAGWKQRRLPLMKTIMTQICEAIRELHGRGWCHGDLNSSNILVQLGSLPADAKVTVIDLGGSMPGKRGAGACVMAHPLFISPEVRGLGNGKCHQGLVPPPDMLAYDIWSMGCLLVLCLTGEDAFNFPGLSQCSAAAILREVDKKHREWADKHTLFRKPRFCKQAPFCKIARQARSDERYDSCWQLLLRMLEPSQERRAQIQDVITSKFISIA
ncbi:hypothetical protein ABBQ38_007599 [Trebouxia sp. C0009 RCD-2024]